MNVLLVTPEFRPKVGGMGRSADRLGAGFAAAGHDTTILTYHRTGDIFTAPYARVDTDCPPGLRVLRVGPIATKYSGAEPETKAFLKRQFVDQSLRAIRTGAPPALVLSFGRATWPHLLVRALLAEQIYRAQQILAGHPYHRD